MRLGIFGGTFDPVHLGHLILAEHCREQVGLDAVWFVPAGQPPHKSGQITAGDRRCEMLELATAGYPEFQVSDLEVKKDGPSYTVETLEQIQREQPDAELFFLMGADSLDDLPHWREPQRIAELARLVAVNRGRQQLPDFPQLEQRLGPQVAGRIDLVSMPAVDVSASELRHRAAAGKSVRFLVTRAVEAYIDQHAVYTAVDSVES